MPFFSDDVPATIEGHMFCECRNVCLLAAILGNLVPKIGYVVPECGTNFSVS